MLIWCTNTNKVYKSNIKILLMDEDLPILKVLEE